jgi:transposase
MNHEHCNTFAKINGFAEGVNLKIKLLNRRAFGYRNFDNFRLHILMAFGQ